MFVLHLTYQTKTNITMENLIKFYESLSEQYTEFTNDSDRNTHYDFLCNFIEKKMIIGEEDRINLFTHFKTQRPTYNGYRKIYLNELCNKDKRVIVWFSSHRYLGKQIRIQFLKEIIKKLNKNLVNQKPCVTFDVSK
jgi:hypothetical protein